MLWYLGWQIKKLCKQLPESIYCVFHAGEYCCSGCQVQVFSYANTPMLKTTKLTTKLQKPASPNPAGTVPVMRWALNSLVPGTWTNRWKAALTETSNISNVQYHQWHTEPSLRFQYTGHVPIQRAFSTVHSSVYKSFVRKSGKLLNTRLQRSSYFIFIFIFLYFIL